MSEVQKQPSKVIVKLPIAHISQEELEAQLPDLENWAACNPNIAELKIFRDRAMGQICSCRRTDISGTLTGVFSILAKRIAGKQEAQEGLNGKRFEVAPLTVGPKAPVTPQQEKEAEQPSFVEIQEDKPAKETQSPEPQDPEMSTPDIADLLMQLEAVTSLEDLEAFKDVMLQLGRWEVSADGIVAVTNKGDAGSAWQKNRARNEKLLEKCLKREDELEAKMPKKEKAKQAKLAEKQRKEDELQSTKQELEIDGAKVEIGYYIKDGRTKVFQVLNVEGKCSIKAGTSGRFDGLPPALRHALDPQAAKQMDERSTEARSERIAEQSAELEKQWRQEKSTRQAKRQAVKAASNNDKKSRSRSRGQQNRENKARKAA